MCDVVLTTGVVPLKAANTLATWIGHADLMAMADNSGDQIKLLVESAIKSPIRPRLGDGPIKTLLKQRHFDDVHLLSNYSSPVNRAFARWIERKPVVHAVNLVDPTDYEKVFSAADEVLGSIVKATPKTQLSIHLSPGSPAMAAVWVLLGKSRYPATFFQTHNGRAWETEIPFDLIVDFVPKVLQGPDAALQHLALRGPKDVAGFQSIIGDSQPIRVAVGRAAKASVRDVPILLLGESGTGKELFARAIHAASHRRDRPFISINCAAIPRDLLESELFGHKKGAFTGATQDREGAFKIADGGTLFLDEIGECEFSMQVKLLRVLQPPPGAGACRRVFSRIGETKDLDSDVRIIAATNADLHTAIRDNRFRSDLFYRLSVITINLPPLRERGKDAILLAQSILDQVNAEFRIQEPGYKDKFLSVGAKAFVSQHTWPGNVRQLYNSIVQAAVMASGDAIQKADLHAAAGDFRTDALDSTMALPLGDGFDLVNHLESMQRHYLQRAMDEAGGVKTKAAKLLGYKNYQTLDAQLKRLGVRSR